MLPSVPKARKFRLPGIGFVGSKGSKDARPDRQAVARYALAKGIRVARLQEVLQPGNDRARQLNRRDSRTKIATSEASAT